VKETNTVAANIEIKARLPDWDRAQGVAQSLSDCPLEIIQQRDVFFNVPKGRLKLRVLAPDRGQLVYYEREDAAGPRRSNYVVSPVADPTSTETLLTVSLGVRGVVSKTRYLYIVGHTRVHLDRVEGLGHFLELESVLGPDHSEDDGQGEVSELMARLGIAEDDLIDVAYIDLLELTSA
jgi:predicted adenylyl cyclase CyaB